MFEAVASARLAGAGTDFAAAREMLRAGRPAGDPDESMVLNIHEALHFARDQASRPLSAQTVLLLHRLLTQGIPANAGSSGRLRREDEIPPALPEGGAAAPAAGELPARLDAICAFANGVSPGVFIHPVIRGILLHFWIAHDRPFADANGRAARVLFYWSLWRQGYGVFDFLPLSAALVRDPERYRRSFWEAETDDNDLTYFIMAQLDAIRTGMSTWREDLARKERELKDAAGRLPGFASLNPRQRAVLGRAVRRPDTDFVIAGHQRSHGVTHQTARDDLFDLVRREYLTVTRERRVYHFRMAAEQPRRVPIARTRRRGAKPSVAAEALPTSLL